MRKFIPTLAPDTPMSSRAPIDAECQSPRGRSPQSGDAQHLDFPCGFSQSVSVHNTGHVHWWQKRPKKGRFDGMLTEGPRRPILTFPPTTAEGQIIDVERPPDGGVFLPKGRHVRLTVEAKDFGCLVPDFRAAGAEVIGISPDGVESHVRFKAKHAFDVRLAADTEKTVAGAYGVWVEKSMYGRKYMGVERATFSSTETGKVAASGARLKSPVMPPRYSPQSRLSLKRGELCIALPDFASTSEGTASGS